MSNQIQAHSRRIRPEKKLGPDLVMAQAIGQIPKPKWAISPSLPKVPENPTQKVVTYHFEND